MHIPIPKSVQTIIPKELKVRSLAFVLLVLTSTFSINVQAQSTEQDVEKDSNMIYEALDNYVKGWMSKDASLLVQ